MSDTQPAPTLIAELEPAEFLSQAAAALCGAIILELERQHPGAADRILSQAMRSYGKVDSMTPEMQRQFQGFFDQMRTTLT